MENQKNILLELSNKISKIDCRQPCNKIVKEVDLIVQQSYLDLYKLYDIKCNKEVDQKKNGHCC